MFFWRYHIIVRVIDAPCGAGKTTWAIREMNSNTDHPYVYCTPLLDEIGRIREDCARRRFMEPEPYTGSKLDGFNILLSRGENIAVTHTTFLNSTDETLSLIHEGNYRLILDEVLDVIVDFNDCQTVTRDSRQSITASDLKNLRNTNQISIKENGRVEWIGDRSCQNDGTFKNAEVIRYADLGRLYCVRGTFLLTVFPPEMFSTFKDITVLTYLFDGSLLKYYFQIFGIDFCMASISNDGTLTEYTEDADRRFRKQCRELIEICNSKGLNKSNRVLSKSWYMSSGKENKQELKRDLTNYFKHIVKCSSEDIMWTCPKEYRNSIQGSGYKQTHRLSEEEKALTGNVRKEAERKADCFVPCNSRATNIYRKRRALAYCCNMFFNPMISGFFKGFNKDIKLNEDMFALSCLIQWICRSRIRDGEKINIYIPSERMRGLLIHWMYYYDGVTTTD